MLLKMRIECGQVSPAGLAKRIEPQTFQVGASRNPQWLLGILLYTN